MSTLRASTGHSATTGAARRRLLLQAGGAAFEAIDLPQLADTSVALLARAIDATLGGVFRTISGTAMEVAVPSTQVHAAQALAEYGEVAACDPVHRAKVAHNPALGVVSDLVSTHERAHSAADGVLGRYDAQRQLVLRLSAIPHGQPGATGIVLARSRRQPAFDRDVLAELDALRPIFAAAIARNDRCRTLGAIANACAGAAVAFEPSGRVAWMSAEAEALLGGRELPASLGETARRICTFEDHDAPALAGTALAFALPGAALAVALPGARPGMLPGARPGTRPGPLPGTRPGAHPGALPGVLPGAEPLEAVFVRTRRDASEPPLAIARLRRARPPGWSDALPPRLRRVLELLKTGASEKEIADRAGLSCASAHQYIVQIYRRAGVASRAQLMAMLARDVTDP